MMSGMSMLNAEQTVHHQNSSINLAHHHSRVTAGRHPTLQRRPVVWACAAGNRTSVRRCDAPASLNESFQIPSGRFSRQIQIQAARLGAVHTSNSKADQVSLRQGARTGIICRVAVTEEWQESKVQPWQIICAVTAISMLLCNMHRSVFTIMTPAIAKHFELGLGQVGIVQSSMLAGYMLGQVPAGMLSDRYGGEWVMVVCLLLWSCSLWATGSAGSEAALIASRVGFGLASACAMPAVSAMASRHVPSQIKGSTIALIYACFNLGGVLGLVMTPTLSLGWRAIMHNASMGGVAWALLGMGLIKTFSGEPTPMHSSRAHSGGQAAGSTAQAVAKQSRGYAGLSAMDWRRVIQVAILCWTHAVMGWGFFIFQGWIPMYLQSLNPGLSLASTGSMSAMTWLAALVVGAVSGSLADRLITKWRWPRLTVRKVFQSFVTLGCLVCLVPLVVLNNVTPLVATACLTAFNCCYVCSFGGFHPYIQDVAVRGSAGRLTGMTNTCGILMGILGNLSTGLIVQATGSYKGILLVTGLLYITSFLAFLALDGKEV